MVVVKMGEQFEFATKTLEDQFFVATPCITDGEIVLLGQNTIGRTHQFRISSISRFPCNTRTI